MKHPCLIVISLFLIAFSFSQCKKNKDASPQLPAETTTGAMTFGCKVNGQVFVPKDGNGHPGLYVQYVYLGSGPGGGWYLGLNANNWQDTNIPTVRIKTDSLLLSDGTTYSLKNQKGYVMAEYDKGSDFYILLNVDTGQLTVTKHDQIQRILSGNFWFTATSQTGQKINITEGRFDVRY